jgi:hypothetical protein
MYQSVQRISTGLAKTHRFVANLGQFLESDGIVEAAAVGLPDDIDRQGGAGFRRASGARSERHQ